MTEHFLNTPKVGSSFEQVRGERVAEQMRVDALRLRPRLRGEPAQDQDGAGAREWPTLRDQEQLRPVPAVEVRAAAGEVAAQGLDGLTADRHDALLVPLADAADEPLVERDAALVERDGLGDAQPGSVEELDERAIAEVARARPGRRVDQPLGLAG